MTPKLRQQGREDSGPGSAGELRAGMLFVRCKGGVSQNPAEPIGEDDCAIALAALTRFAEDFRAA